MNELNQNTNPLVSVDCVIFGFDFEKLNVLLLERRLQDNEGNLVFTDKSLVGHHIKISETLEDAAVRILYDTTGVENIYLEQFHTFSGLKRFSGKNDIQWLDSISRNPEQRVITVGYFSLVNSTEIDVSHSQQNASWHEVSKVGQLAFDHNDILKKGLEALRIKIKLAPIAFELLPQKFTLSQLHKLYESILDMGLDKRNFWKKAQQTPYIVALNEKQKDVSHKPAQLFMFSRDIYEVTKMAISSFNF